MAEVKAGEDHLRSLRDGRAVYIDGERVADVTTHPAFRNAVKTAAALYDLQARPENLERLTFVPERADGDGYARVNRCTGRGIQQPSLEVYRDGEMVGYHALDDDWASSFRDSGRHWLRWLHTREGPMLWSGDEAVDVLRFALAAYASSEAGGLGVDPAELGTRS